MAAPTRRFHLETCKWHCDACKQGGRFTSGPHTPLVFPAWLDAEGSDRINEAFDTMRQSLLTTRVAAVHHAAQPACTTPQLAWQITRHELTGAAAKAAARKHARDLATVRRVMRSRQA